MGNLKWLDFFRGLVLIGSSTAASFLFIKGYYLSAVFLSIFGFIVFYQILRANYRLSRDIFDFAEAVKYKDFTRRYSDRNSKPLEKKLYGAFNQLNSIYKDISVKKDIQHQYLNKVVNMLDSAILFYHAESGKVEWVNDAFKQMFEIPHIGNVRGLKRRRLDLYEKTMQLTVGEQQIETTLSTKGRMKLLIQVSEFETEEGLFRIVVYQNVDAAIDETESNAYQKLLRVLTHEIMNSIAPISSIAESLHHRLRDSKISEEFDDVKVGIGTIKSRSEGLLKFAKSYRLINKVDNPQFESVQISQLFENIYQLLDPSFTKMNIEVDIILKNPRLSVGADLHLLEQVMINLMLNAMEAVKEIERPYISMKGYEENGRSYIQVSDNGLGMDAEILEQIFTPFFTTKKTGSGIGLTLCKQIMLVHRGNVFAKSESGKGTTFTLQFANKK